MFRQVWIPFLEVGIKYLKQLIALGGENSSFESRDILVLNSLKGRLESFMVNAMAQGTVDTYFKPISQLNRCRYFDIIIISTWTPLLGYVCPGNRICTGNSI